MAEWDEEKGTRPKLSFLPPRKRLRVIEDVIWEARGFGIPREKIEEVVQRALDEFDDELEKNE